MLSMAQSSRPGWGATPYAGVGGTGVTFRLWAPAATSVHVAGSFNGWSSTSLPLTRETNASIWSRDVSNARTNDNYKYVVNGTLWRTDPRSRAINTADNNNSIVTSTNTFPWNGDSFSITNASDLVLYEAHVGTFVGLGGTFNTFTSRLDYLEDLGISAIELMPINEFPSATSWGYNPAYPFAIESSYGAPDSLKRLVEQSHERGMVLMIDVVHNHWDGGSSLWQLDGTTPGPYFYADDPYANTYWGPRPDYSKAEVREYINDTFRMWLDEFHISGFRWDAPKHSIYTTNNVYIPDGMLMITNALALMATNYPGTWNIAEDTKEISGFNYYWDLTFRWELMGVLTQSDDNLRDMPTVVRNINGTPARIIFTDSHDTAGDLNGGQRLPVLIHGGDPTGYYARKRSALGAAIVMTAPGTPMILQGQELLETNQFSDTRAMDWSRTNTQAGTYMLYRDLIRLRRNLDGVSSGLLGDLVSTYHVDNGNKLIAYSRASSTATGGTIVVVANFANATRSGYTIPFPEEGTWYTLFNSDATNYASDYGNAGSMEVAAAGNPPQGTLTIAPYSVLVLSKTPRSGMLVQEQHHLDQPGGNNDGVLDPGETVQGRFVLWNKSQVAATNVVAQLVTDTPGVTIEQGISTYPSMGPDATGTNDILFQYRLSSTQACGSVVGLRLVTSFNSVTVTSVIDRTVGYVVEVPPVTNAFLSTDTPMFIPDTSTVYSLLAIDLPGSNTITDIDVRVRINHTFDRDITLGLQHPDGTEVLLVRRRGGSANNFGTGNGTCTTLVYAVFDQSAATSISSGTAPFAGTYRPEATLATLNGKLLNGTWKLRMRDETTDDVGTNLCWQIVATYEQLTVACNAYSNSAPVVAGTNIFMYAPGPAAIPLSGSDPDGQPLTFIANGPGHGLLSFTSPTGGLAAYQPVHGFLGTDTFTFAATDGALTSSPATAWIVVAAAEDADADGLPDSWEVDHFTNTSAHATGDDDGDGMNNRDEYLANTDPLDPASMLRIAQVAVSSGWHTVRWQSRGGSRYELEYSTDLVVGFEPITRPFAQEVDPSSYGIPSSMQFVDDYTLTDPPGTNALRLYRVRVVNE
jgi:1,4-alpha-glucan branching enzyme